MPDSPRLPAPGQHIAIAGRTGSGKTIGALSMLATRDLAREPWIIIDHKRDENIAALPAEPLSARARFLPSRGLHLVRADRSVSDRYAMEELLERVFKRGNFGVYIDEGHLFGQSPAVRDILVAGRSKGVSLMWTSQRAHHIDTFIWSQSAFFRVFRLQSAADVKRYNENFPERWRKPPEFHSWYYDVARDRLDLLRPAPEMPAILNNLDTRLRRAYRSI